MENLLSKSYKIYSPSYKRSKIAFSHKLFLKERFCYVVREEEFELYKTSFPDVEIKMIPQGKVTNISDTRNWILDNRESDYVVMVDDDMSAIHWLKERKQVKLDAENIDQIFQRMFLLAEESGCGMWGMNLNSDPKAYRVYTPFSFGNPILGPFTAILDTDPGLRYDPELSLKEDYDYSLQQIMKHRRALRVNFLNYMVDHENLEGGCQTYRNREKEKHQNELLQKKWGSELVRPNYRNRGSINMWVKTGL